MISTQEGATTRLLGLVERLVVAIEELAANQGDPELRAFTPAQAAKRLSKTENWVTEAIQADQIPYTRVGKSPRMTAAHIRWVLQDGERLPNKYSKLRPAA
ncbi:hypothetical protein Salbus254_5873 [Streptomyces albidoflavus]|uniref:hypothetical protein n=1 Tax=Streptomyces albidoflavus TaxID=1886 RepID=UPI000775DDE3|nr:hypothetical protein [Streptomyces albidoflavus]AMM12301.1 hypothetical protein Salbus254_5873 [Streptomyces albidoflavus]